MPTYYPGSIKGKAVSNRRMIGSGYGSFLPNTLGGLQDADGQPSAYAGNGLGMGMRTAVMPQMGGNGLSSINKKLESLMVKASKSKPKNIRFNM